jgi:hypothetical protein
MLYLNPAIIPNPDAPAAFDAYGRETGPELVVVASALGWPMQGEPLGPTTLTCAFRGTMVDLRADRLAVILASAGLRPLGRMERREAAPPHVRVKYEVGRRLRYNGPSDWNLPQFRVGDVVTVEPKNGCGMGIDVRSPDGVVDMVWPWEVNLEEQEKL